MSTAATQQRRAALVQANQVRQFRAQVRADLKDLKRNEGAHYCAVLIEDCPNEMNTMPVDRLLEMVKHINRAKAHTILANLHIGGHRSIGGLTSRQRKDLVSRLRGFQG